MTDESVQHSSKRFVEKDQNYFNAFFFVSNARYEHSNAQSKLGRNPKKFLEAIKRATSQSDLTSPFDTTFEELRQHCNCDAASLLATLKKLDFLPSPDLDGFEAVIAHDHLPKIPPCRTLPAEALAILCDELISQVSKASSRSIDGPSRHLHGLNMADRDNPILQAKRITIESVLSFIREERSHLLEKIKDPYVLQVALTRSSIQRPLLSPRE